MPEHRRDDRGYADRPLAQVLTGLAGALPTLALIVLGPNLLVDDWSFADLARSNGLGGFAAGVDVRSRPLQALYHALTFVILGDHPVAHLLLLAALNGAAAWLFLRVCRTQLSSRTALLAAGAWVVVANHGASRLWISTGPTMVAVVLLLIAAHAALRATPRFGLAVGLAAASMLAYEGGAAIGLAIALVAAWRSTPADRRWIKALVATALLGATAVSVYLTSPKLDGGSAAQGQPADAVPALLGSALMPSWLADVSVIVLTAVLIVFVLTALREFRRPEAVLLLVAGVVTLILGVVPFIVVKFPLSTDGMLDRANVFASFGAALLLAAVLDQLWRLPATAAVSLAAIILMVLASANATDISGARDAGLDGQALLTALRNEPFPEGQRVVIAPLPNRNGYAAFGYDSLAAAARLAIDRPLDLHDSLSEREFIGQSGLKFRFIDGQLVAYP